MDIESIMRDVAAKNPNEVEYLQAVNEVLISIEETYKMYPQFQKAGIIERLIEPDRVITFKVPWVDDQGQVRVNKGYRVQFNNILGPYKGGLRFHPSVNISILKFLGFEQIFKNSLTTLPLGGAKGGSDFNPKGKSNNEIMRFCQSFMLELWKIIGPSMDVPAGDIGVGTREIGYLYGMYRKLTDENTGVFTGKGLEWGGSLLRPEATGYGVVYFANEMLSTIGASIEGKMVAISGFGNVAWGTVKKINELGGKVVTLSGPDGYIFDKDGVCNEKIEYMLDLRASNEDIVQPFAEKFKNVEFHPNKRPWEVKCDIALPCATQNELNDDDARELLKNKCICICEGANMPCTPEAIEIFHQAKVLYAPGKASNAGGVATSGLEMAQNSMKIHWSRDEVDKWLHHIMKSIHEVCVRYGKGNDGYVNYEKGANIGGFLKVAHAMMDQGII
ncbi:MAG: NADP-specific glutamate dehydrogenase [Bacteroidales bacterium]|nr:NADP-specific glutamate dehydrogenase [Bacteroidales bacterium]